MNQQQQIRYLQIELSKVKAEATQLRKRLGENNRHKRRIERAYEDALLMAFWRSAGIKPTRRFAAQYGMTQDRWQNALALLRMARLIQGRSRWPGLEMDITEKRLTTARDRALSDPEAFFLRHTRHQIR